MKLFLIIYAAGKIGGVVGPLPYDLAECQVRADEMTAKTEMIIKTGRSTNGENEVVSPKDLELIKTMKFKCEYRDQKPELGSAE